MKNSLSVAALAVLVVALMMTTGINASSNANELGKPPVSGPFPFNEGLPQNNALFDNFTRELMVGGSISAFAIGDLNNDRRPDLAVGYSDRNGVDIYYQSAQGLFPRVPSRSIHTSNHILALTCGDYDGDGLTDVVVGNGTRLNGYRQSDGFTSIETICDLGFDIIHGVVQRDFDKNGKLDFALIADDGSTAELSIQYNSGILPFSPKNYDPLPNVTKPRSIAVGDFDNNGLDDLVIADAAKNIVAGYVNGNDTGKHWNPTFQISAGLSRPSDIFINNTDGLGNRLAVASANEIRIYDYAASSRVFGISSSKSMAGVRAVAPIDFDKNNRLDIAAVSNSSNNASILLSPMPNTQYGFPVTAFPCLDDPAYVGSTDFNGDGKQDLLIASGGKSGNSSIVIYYRTNSTMSNANDNVILDGKNPDSVTLGRYGGTAFNAIATLNRTGRVITFSDGNMNLLRSLSVAHALLAIISDDLTQTGYDDLVALDQNGRVVTVYWGNVNFYSGNNPSLMLTTGLPSPSSIATGDLTGGPGKEIVVGLANGIEIFKNSGTAPFFNSNNNFSLPLPGTAISAVDLGDFDVGYELDLGYSATNDIALVNSTSNSIQIYFNTRDGATPFRSGSSFHHLNTSIDLSHFSKIQWLAGGDVNGDGLKDLVVGLSDGRTLVFAQGRMLQNGFDVAASVTFQTTYGSDHGTTADLDDDGVNEIVVSSDRSGQVTAFDGAGTSLKAMANWTVGAGNVLPWCGDVNGDNRTDLIAAATRSGSVSVYYQNDLSPKARMSQPIPNSPFEGEKTFLNASATTDGLSDLRSLNYTWIFDNTTVEPGKMVNHTFIMQGMHAYTLIVRDREGRVDTLYGTIVVKDTVPTANFNFSPSSPKEWHQVNFTDASSSNTNTINDWFWDFGDGATSAARDPNHVYDFYGSYNVRLRVSETDGSSNLTIRKVDVALSVPLVGFITTHSPTEGQIITFTDTSNAFRDTIIWREWDFGDGTAKVNTSSIITTHKYDYSGTYPVTLRMEDNESAVGWTIETVVVADRIPSADFDASSMSIAENGTVQFTDRSTTYIKDHVAAWNWSFGDGSFDRGQNPIHRYLLRGSYQVTLEVRCNDSGDWSAPHAIAINVNDVPPAARFNLVPGIWYEGNNTIQFTDASTCYWLDPITQWSWNFGDGSGSTVKNPTHTYRWEGEYAVSLLVGSSDGVLSNVAFSTVRILNAIPLVSIQVITPAPYVVGDFVTFEDVSTLNPDTMVKRLWESDGMTGSDPTFSHQFNANSNFLVKLTLWSNDSAVGVSARISIDLEPSNVSISIADRVSNYSEDSLVTFVVAATPAPTDPIVNYVWGMSFGTDFVPQPPRTENTLTWHFNQSGSYLVKVRVYDLDGYTEASTQITIHEVEPVLSFNFGNLNSPGPVWFNANQTHDTPSDEPFLMFRWNFGDSSPWSDWSSDATTSHAYLGDGNYSVILQVKDDSGEIISLSRSVVVDRSPPSIQITPVYKAYIGEPIQVYANVTDIIGVQQVFLYFTIGNQTSMVQMVLVNQAGSYVAEIPAQNRSVNLSYAISAVDVSGISSPLSPSFQIIISQHPANDLPLAVIALALIMLAGLMAYAFVTKPVVDEVFVIYEDGSLLSHDTRHLKPGMDDQILSSMLIALQSFVKDSFKDETMTDLKRMEFGEKRILVERQGPIFLAVILRGRRDGKASSKMKDSLREINQRFGDALNPWDGDLEKVRGVKDSVNSLVKRKRTFGNK